VAPHPDDEILGVGGVTTLLAADGTETVLVAVTDGEASHPERSEELRVSRPLESAAAAKALGTTASHTHRLRHPDGAVDQVLLIGDLLEVIGPGDLVLTSWWHDGHPDHDRVGRATLAAGRLRGAETLGYPVWAWHWASPEKGLPWKRAHRVDLGVEITRRKASAVQCFATQITGTEPVLSSNALRRWTRPFEVLLRP
jgi:LmbE family N-acetylglucosaminyl deacetylase